MGKKHRDEWEKEQLATEQELGKYIGGIFLITAVVVAIILVWGLIGAFEPKDYRKDISVGGETAYIEARHPMGSWILGMVTINDQDICVIRKGIRGWDRKKIPFSSIREISITRGWFWDNVSILEIGKIWPSGKIYFKHDMKADKIKDAILLLGGKRVVLHEKDSVLP